MSCTPLLEIMHATFAQMQHTVFICCLTQVYMQRVCTHQLSVAKRTVVPQILQQS